MCASLWFYFRPIYHSKLYWFQSLKGTNAIWVSCIPYVNSKVLRLWFWLLDIDGVYPMPTYRGPSRFSVQCGTLWCRGQSSLFLHHLLLQIGFLHPWNFSSEQHFDKSMKEVFLHNLASSWALYILPSSIHKDMFCEACFLLTKLIFFEYFPLDVFYFIFMSIFLFTDSYFTINFVFFNLDFFIVETFHPRIF